MKTTTRNTNADAPDDEREIKQILHALRKVVRVDDEPEQVDALVPLEQLAELKRARQGSKTAAGAQKARVHKKSGCTERKGATHGEDVLGRLVLALLDVVLFELRRGVSTSHYKSGGEKESERHPSGARRTSRERETVTAERRDGR